MPIQNVTLAQNNYSKKYNPSFTSIKSVKCEGLYKKYPELANDVVEAFKNNPRAMDFCKKYDVDVVFYAMKEMQDAVNSSVHIFYDKVTKSKVGKFWGKLTGNSKDEVVVHAFENKYSLPKSMKASTEKLIEAISSEKKAKEGFRGGLLDTHLQLADIKIQNDLRDKSGKVLEKEAKSATAKDSETQTKIAAAKLLDSIDDLVKKGS